MRCGGLACSVNLVDVSSRMQMIVDARRFAD